MGEELKPCPLCGGEAVDDVYEAYSTDSSFDYIGCNHCSLMLQYERDRGWNSDSANYLAAVTAWNRRTQGDQA